MTPAALRDLFRVEMLDNEAPYLWSDTEVDGYIEDAHTMFYRLTGGRADASTAAVTDIVIAADDQWVDLHEKIVRIKGAYRTDTGRPIAVLNFEDLPTLGYRLDDQTGAVKALIIGMTPHKARVYPISNETVTIKLIVTRLPLQSVITAGAFEIEEHHHRHLLEWTKHLAYSKQDSQTFDRTRSEESEDRFRAYCERARIEWDREKHKPRSVAYGGL